MTNLLQLDEQQIRQIIRHSNRELPDEACGLIAGNKHRAAQIIPITNIAEDPKSRFYMRPTELARALKQIEANHLSLIGIYHSHPDTPPIPSPTDIREALYPDIAHLIVSPQKSGAQLKAWLIQEYQVEPIELIISDQEHHPTLLQEELTRTQKVAIILGALLAFVSLIIIAIVLLPPPPELPR